MLFPASTLILHSSRLVEHGIVYGIRIQAVTAGRDGVHHRKNAHCARLSQLCINLGDTIKCGHRGRVLSIVRGCNQPGACVCARQTDQALCATGSSCLYQGLPCSLQHTLSRSYSCGLSPGHPLSSIHRRWGGSGFTASEITPPPSFPPSIMVQLSSWRATL